MGAVAARPSGQCSQLLSPQNRHMNHANSCIPTVALLEHRRFVSPAETQIQRPHTLDRSDFAPKSKSSQLSCLSYLCPG